MDVSHTDYAGVIILEVENLAEPSKSEGNSNGPNYSLNS